MRKMRKSSSSENAPPKQITSIFQTLKYSGENFFENREMLNGIREKCDQICADYQKKFKEFLDNHDKATIKDQVYVDEVLFRPIEMKKPKEFDFEKRLDITKSEEDLIKSACKNKKIPLSELENIKFSLGFKAHNLTHKKPCVAVVGQTKSGKSSLVNCILQEGVVPQRVMRQTARVTYVTHCDTRFVAYLHNSKLIKIELEEEVKNEDVDLKNKDRAKTDQISIEVRVGTPNPIVKNGFDIVDSPGLNENPALNDLCARMEKSLLPLLIYVVDGRNGLQQADIDDIKLIKIRTPDLKIIYFTTKLARSKYDRVMYEERKAKKKLKDDEDMPGESDIEVANRRLDKVLRKMKLHAFVPPSTKILDSREFQREFHGADIWVINDKRIHYQEKELSKCDEFNHRLMLWFEESLMLYLKGKLEGPLKDELQYIESPLEDVLEKATSAASDIASDKFVKQKSIETFKNKEQELYDSQCKYTEDTLKMEIPKLIKDCQDQIIQIIEDVQSGNSKGKKRREGFNNFTDEVKKQIEESLDEEIKLFVTKFMVEKEQHLKKHLLDIVELLTTGRHGNTSFEIMLKNRLFYEYEFFVCAISSSCDQSDNYSKSVERVDKKMKSFGCLTAGLFKSKRSGSDQQQQSARDQGQWKSKLANQIISDIDMDTFLKTLCDLVGEEFKNRHDGFVKQLEEQKEFLNKNISMSDDEKKCIKAFAEQIGVQFALAFHVKTPLLLTIDPLRKPEIIGAGGQAQVKTVYLIGKDEPIVEKHYRHIFPSLDGSTTLPQIAMEIYYSGRLNDPCCLQLLGIRFEKSEGGWKFSTYYPYLKFGSMKDFFGRPTKEKPPLCYNPDYIKERLELSLEFAKGIEFLHKLQIVHRDINLQNVLVREVTEPKEGKHCKFEAVIADYGLAKSVGFIDQSGRIGTPLYMAPELLNQEHLKHEGYSPAVDVFSFGISTWQLLTYNLTEDYSNYFPKFVIDCEQQQATIEKYILDGERPEERTLIPPCVNDLLKLCWHKDPMKRPVFIKTGLVPDCDHADDPMLNKTIVEILTECLNRIRSGGEETVNSRL